MTTEMGRHGTCCRGPCPSTGAASFWPSQSSRLSLVSLAAFGAASDWWCLNNRGAPLPTTAPQVVTASWSRDTEHWPRQIRCVATLGGHGECGDHPCVQLGARVRDDAVGALTRHEEQQHRPLDRPFSPRSIQSYKREPAYVSRLASISELVASAPKRCVEIGHVPENCFLWGKVGGTARPRDRAHADRASSGGLAHSP